ncbi:MAG: 6-phosphogluconolactonase [Planctomycetota bacterium]|jgi:glucosamine-6-phosphate deaminase
MAENDAECTCFKREVLPSEERMGDAAGGDVGNLLREQTAKRGRPVLVNFAAAPSQDAFLAALSRQEGIDWTKVTAIHLDEYIDLPRGHPNTFEAYLREHIFSRVPVPDENVHYIRSIEAETPDQVAREYEAELKRLLASVREAGGQYVACIGIGVNGHVAFNEPHVDKRTARMVIPVEIDDVSVQQQYDDYKDHPDSDARYASLAEVPRRAVTMSCAGILAADCIFCIVPGAHKVEAVRKMCDGAVTDQVPASLLRLHPDVTVYLDADSARLLDRRPELA